MTPYLALFKVRCRVLLQYRTAAIAGLGTQLFWGLIKIMVMEAFYRESRAAQPMSYADVVTYTWLGQAFFMMLPFSANPDPEVRNMMRSGAVAYELARPLDLYGLWYARAIAARTAPTLLRAAPMFALALPFFGMHLPPSVPAALAWAVAMVGALLLVSAASTLITITLLWTISGDGIARIVPSLALLGSGMIIPLPFFPAGVQTLLNLLPFRGMADAPFRLYMGHLPPEEVGGVLLHQLVWTALFVGLGRLLLARGTRVLVVQGG
jgi:ABC-2 type transport system permease protein